jgi:predicted membrane-bound spermidine synthase
MKKDEEEISKGYYYTISFLEGGAVMVIELLGAKIIAPYYGASLYVWSSVLGVTLGGLALGYFLGGYLSEKLRNQNLLFTVILLGAFFTCLAPLTAPKIMYFTDSLGIRFGSLISVLLFLSPPLVCMGMVSPIIIQLINKNEGAGKAAGSVYAISTVGGIFATFLFGFYLIPETGIRASSYITGSVLGLIALAYFILANRYIYLAITAGMILLLKLLSPHYPLHTNTKIQYHSEGLLGQLSVIDYDFSDQPVKPHIRRGLYLDGIKQTNTQVGIEPFSLWDYPHKITAFSCIKPAGSKALLLGMGGGSIAFELVTMGFDLDIVELDPRIPKIAKKYFNYDAEKSNMIIDDARHYIRKSPKKYDLVIFDILRGECQPSYIFTVEGLNDLKKILNKDALVIINFQGNMEKSSYSLGPRSVYKTLLASGMYVNFGEQAATENNTGDLIFIASDKKYDFKNLLENNRYYEWFTVGKYKYEDMISRKEAEVSDAYLLVDDKPVLELLNAPVILAWRKTMMEANAKKFVGLGIPLY